MCKVQGGEAKGAFLGNLFLDSRIQYQNDKDFFDTSWKCLWELVVGRGDSFSGSLFFGSINTSCSPCQSIYVRGLWTSLGSCHPSLTLCAWLLAFLSPLSLSWVILIVLNTLYFFSFKMFLLGCQPGMRLLNPFQNFTVWWVAIRGLDTMWYEGEGNKF